MQHTDGGKLPHAETTFGRLIREARLARGESQVSVAARARVSRVHFSRLENDLAEAGQDVQNRIIRALGIDPEFLGDIRIRSQRE